MSKSKRLKKLQGSGILVVTLAAIAFTIYTSTTYSDTEHFGIMIEQYEKINKEYYEKYVKDVDNFYEDIYIKNNMNQ